MKLSERTITILDNFSKINPGIVVKAGSKVNTIHPLARQIIAEANVDDEFATGFAIYDLSKFMGAVSLMKDPDFAFGEKSVVISSGKSTIEYIYANPATVVVPPEKQLKMPSSEVCFNLSSDVFKTLQKAAGALDIANLVVCNKKGHVCLEVRDTENKSSNTFRQTLDEETSGEYELIFEFSNLKILPGNYDVKISSKKISEFKSLDMDLTYWILLNASSTFKK